MAMTRTYTYGDTDWLDKLTAHNGNSISYDGAGNMTAYNGNSFVWAEGRNLKQINLSDGRVVKMYDHEGTRYRKDVINGSSTVSTYYTYHGRKLMHQGNMHFFYDAQGRPAQVKQGSNVYNYVLNAQGDVVGLTNASGTLVVEYKYDAWGKLLGISGSLASSIGTNNPLRYRGYCYDTESGLYYLHSRYYNPELRRFISADDTAYLSADGNILANNLYTYCINNPVIRIDQHGKSSLSVAAWATGMSWLPLVDGPLPIGDIIYGVGFILSGAATLGILSKSDRSTGKTVEDPDDEVPDIAYPGDDGTVSPGEDYEWKGKKPVGGSEGTWKNSKTGEQLHPDLDHAPPVGPHWDYTNGRKPKKWWRIFPDGRLEQHK